MAGNGNGSFSKWASSKINPEVKKFVNWAAEKASSRPIGRLEETMQSGRAAQPPSRAPLLPADTEPYGAPPKGPVKVPEMLKSKYWRPGAKEK